MQHHQYQHNLVDQYSPHYEFRGYLHDLNNQSRIGKRTRQITSEGVYTALTLLRVSRGTCSIEDNIEEGIGWICVSNYTIISRGIVYICFI